MRNIKVKAFHGLFIKELEDKINEYICEDLDGCDVMDIKYSCVVDHIEGIECVYKHFALLLYV